MNVKTNMLLLLKFVLIKFQTNSIKLEHVRKDW